MLFEWYHHHMFASQDSPITRPFFRNPGLPWLRLSRRASITPGPIHSIICPADAALQRVETPWLLVSTVPTRAEKDIRRYSISGPTKWRILIKDFIRTRTFEPFSRWSQSLRYVTELHSLTPPFPYRRLQAIAEKKKSTRSRVDRTWRSAVSLETGRVQTMEKWRKPECIIVNSRQRPDSWHLVE